MIVHPRTDSFALTPLQQGMLFHHLQGGHHGVDIEQFVGRLDEDVDADLLREAWQTVADRHDVLRTSFRWTEVDQPCQDVAERVEVPLTRLDWSHLDPATQDAQLDEWLRTDRLAGFDLAATPMWRLCLLRLGAARSCLVFTYHHALLDTSVVWVTQEAFEAYDERRGGPAAALVERRPFADHVRWLDTHLRETRESSQAYYRELLAGLEGPTTLPALAHRRTAEATDADADADRVYGALRFRLSEDTSARLHRLAERTGTPLAAVVEGTWALVLGAFTGSDDVVFGSTRGCRRSALPGSESTIGLFINTPPVRITLDPAEPVDELFRRVRAQQVAKRAHEHLPLTDVQAALDVRDVVAYDSIVVVNELHQGTRLEQLGGPFAARHFDLHDQTNYPLTLLAYLDPQIHLKLSFDRQRFDGRAVERVQELLVQVLDAVAADERPLVGDLPTMSDTDRALVEAWNRSHDGALPGDETVDALIAEQAQRTPAATAVVHRGRQWTYAELDERADRVAAHLRELGVGRDDLVGVFVDRSPEMVAALVGIMRAGAAYVPMDPGYPSARLAMMLEDAAPKVVVTGERLRSSLPAGAGHVITVEQALTAQAAAAPPAERSSADLAYVIFTSGSTGRPKGVMIEHRNVVNFFAAMDEHVEVDGIRERVWLAVTSISFDISVLELFWTLARGFTVVLQDEASRLVASSSSSSSASAPDAAPAPATTRTRPMEFSLFYFAADATTGRTGRDRYHLLLEGARFADAHGFAAVWTPERHFHEFGGNYPNPALTSVAVAMATERIAIRAGSVVLPLHHPVRCAEDWSVVDNLSNGRVGLSFASGWHANDFALAPANFEERRRHLAEGLDTIRALWRGESVTLANGEGQPVEVKMYPPPVQTAPPVWITTGGTPQTFAMAGRIGANVLTNLLVMTREELARNIVVYRAARREAGHPGEGNVTLMVHTFVGADDQQVRDLVRAPFREYLRTSTDLVNQVRWERTSFARPELHAGSDVAQHSPDLVELAPEEIDAILDHAVDRYFTTAGVFGTPTSCMRTVAELHELGVDELACLVDFGVDDERVLGALEHLDELRARCAVLPLAAAGSAAASASALPAGGDGDDGPVGIAELIRRHRVTHLQCTPSLAAAISIVDDDLEVVRGLHQVLLGGEALPPALVHRLGAPLEGRIVNMYGPTETTVWSTASHLGQPDAPITIGHPLLNTQVHIVDRRLRPVPIGVAGELLIGGAGVVRGYLHRPELTAERFVELPGAGRVYRTGDLVRLLDDGEIEFLGRLDHQVKIRGHRIELGEIEAAIGRSPATFEATVVARTEPGGGEPRLVAYVVPRQADADGTVHAWGSIWDEVYASSTADDATFDVTGWTSSATGEPIDPAQMRDWVESTVERIVALDPQRVLEIGCGTGLLLHRIAPRCSRYVGLDVSQAALDRIAGRLAAAPLPQVELVRGEAHQIAAAVDGPFDTVVVNSVCQYFPDAGYLVDVLAAAFELLAPGGRIFLGDVRSRRHLRHFAAWVELQRAPATIAANVLATRIDERAVQDEELTVDPGLFQRLGARLAGLESVTVDLKAGADDNEMTAYRYDVVLTKAEATASGAAGAAFARPVDVEVDGSGLPDLAVLVAGADGPVRIRGLRNDRLVRDEAVLALLGAGDGAARSVADVRDEVAHVAPGIRLRQLTVPADWSARCEWSETSDDRLDLVLWPSAQEAPSIELTDDGTPWTRFTNVPARRTSNLVADLRAGLRDALPEYMIPTAFVVLPALPRTPNGKIDRNALPEPDRSRQEARAAVAPADEVEETIAGVWRDLLGLDVVGVETNLFDLGANSLLMVQANSRLRAALERELSLVDMFAHPTVRALAAHLGTDPAGAAKAQADAARSRADLRRDAMQRRREVRTDGRRG